MQTIDELDNEALKWAASKGKKQSCSATAIVPPGQMRALYPGIPTGQRIQKKLFCDLISRTGSVSGVELSDFRAAGLSDWPNNASNSPAVNLRDLGVPC